MSLSHNTSQTQSIRLGLIGWTGRMATEIKALLQTDRRFDLQVVVSSSTSASELLPTARSSRASIQVFSNIRDINDASCVDVLIDFSKLENFTAVVQWAADHQKPLVSGVTGLQEEHKKCLQELSSRCPLFYSPNMSLGVAIMREMIRLFSGYTELFQFQIEEIHHKNKKDHPSGTALWLQQRLVEVVGSSAHATTAASVPAPLSMRGGGVFGVHKLWALGEEETLSLEHMALNRRVFARGALEAAYWLISEAKGPGLYSMSDLLSKKG